MSLERSVSARQSPVADSPSPAAQFRLCRDKVGTVGTVHRAKGAKPLQRPADCQLTLPGPTDCINFHNMLGFEKSSASAQALGLIHYTLGS